MNSGGRRWISCLFARRENALIYLFGARLSGRILGALPPNPRSFAHPAYGLDACWIWTARKLYANTRSRGKAPSAPPAAPVALQQSRILRAMLDARFSNRRQPVNCAPE